MRNGSKSKKRFILGKMEPRVREEGQEAPNICYKPCGYCWAFKDSIYVLFDESKFSEKKKKVPEKVALAIRQ